MPVYVSAGEDWGLIELSFSVLGKHGVGFLKTKIEAREPSTTIP